MKLHAIAGLPRSGSTLLCNILNQNPKFYASSTSPMVHAINQLAAWFSNSPEVRSDLINNQKDTEERMVDVARSMMDAWYAGKPTVFDKSRGWTTNALIFEQLYPEGKMIVCVRDPRNVFASIEKQHRRFPILDHTDNPLEKTLYARADQMFSPQGMIGFPIVGVEDLIRRRPKSLILVQYERFVQNPKEEMERIYKELGEPYFDHHFTGIKNTATDVDALYNHKFPHKGEGDVVPSDPEEWKKYLSEDLARVIIERYPHFNNTFGYER